VECWVNSAKSITPILQHSTSPKAIEILSHPLRHALCALLSCRGAAACKSLADRAPKAPHQLIVELWPTHLRTATGESYESEGHYADR
jgi:hypothetical protein